MIRRSCDDLGKYQKLRAVDEKLLKIEKCAGWSGTYIAPPEREKHHTTYSGDACITEPLDVAVKAEKPSQGCSAMLVWRRAVRGTRSGHTRASDGISVRMHAYSSPRVQWKGRSEKYGIELVANGFIKVADLTSRMDFRMF